MIPRVGKKNILTQLALTYFNESAICQMANGKLVTLSLTRIKVHLGFNPESRFAKTSKPLKPA